MPRHFVFALALATLSASAAIAQFDGSLQNTYVAAPDSDSTYSQQEPASIERAPAVTHNRPGYSSAPRISNTQIVAGVWLRSEGGASVQTVSSDKNGAEVRVERGRVNVAVHHPAQDSQILIDLPGGQTALLKDGVYTFNAGSDTVHVLEGEAMAYPANREDDGIKLKDDHLYIFGSGDAHAKAFESTEKDTDLLPGAYPGMDGYGRRSGYGGEYLYAGSPYYGYGPGYGFGSPYYGYGYGYPYGYGWGPWGYGYPFGVGIGFGYYGGFRGGYGGFGGFRGGYGGFGGFRGRR